MRVVSLVPSVTETLMAWGVTPIACTRFCEQPELRHVGGTKDPDLSAIVDLAPDIVVVDEEENRRDDAAALEAAGLAVHVTAVRSVADVGPTLHALAAAVGAEVEVAAIDVHQAAPSRRAFIPIWRRPWMTIGADTYGSSLLAACGVANVFDDAVERYPAVTLEAAATRNPDVVLAPTEPYPFGPRHTAELETVGPVMAIDGQDLFWWGFRTPSAIARLRELLS